MRYVYVLVSNENDLYFEQLLLSVISLRKYNKNIGIDILVDQLTARSLIGRRKVISSYANIVEVQVPETLDNKAKSRWLKTSINKHIDGSFLFIDCDTIICESLHDVDNYSEGVYCVLDKHLDLTVHRDRKNIKLNTRKLGFTSAFKYEKHWNSGVILFIDGQRSQELFNKWHVLWNYSLSKNLVIDQIAFNEANILSDKYIGELAGEWNCQISDNGLPYLASSKIIHYFASNLIRYKSPYIFADKNIYRKIKEGELKIDDIEKMLEKPRSSFNFQSKIIADEAELKIFYSFIGRCIARLFKMMEKKWN